MKARLQVKKEHYSKDYDTLERFISYYFQIRKVLELKPKIVLEIGIGTKLVAWYLKNKGIKVTTCDIDKNLSPDYIADIRELPFKNNAYDLTLACEVLEHIPYADFIKALKEMYRVSKKNAVISIPYSTLNVYGYTKLIPRTKPMPYFIKITDRFFEEHKFGGQHYWEMGKKGYSPKKIRECIKSAGWKIANEFAQPLDPYHYFFILEK